MTKTLTWFNTTGIPPGNENNYNKTYAFIKDERRLKRTTKTSSSLFQLQRTRNTLLIICVYILYNTFVSVEIMVLLVSTTGTKYSRYLYECASVHAYVLHLWKVILQKGDDQLPKFVFLPVTLFGWWHKTIDFLQGHQWIE